MNQMNGMACPKCMRSRQFARKGAIKSLILKVPPKRSTLTPDIRPFTEKLTIELSIAFEMVYKRKPKSF